MMPPIFMLHHVSDDPTYASLKPYSITHESFLRLLNYLEKHHVKTIGFEDVHKQKSASLFAKEVILTFDDCPKHLWDFAIPELQKRNMKAIFYMPTAHLGGINSWDVEEGRTEVALMDETDIQKLIQIGMEVGAHAHEHVRMNDLTSEQVIETSMKSKAILELVSGTKIISFAYPFGSVPLNFVSAMSLSGYLYAASIFHSSYNVYALRRIIYHDGDTNKTLRFKLSIGYKFYRTIIDRIL